MILCKNIFHSPVNKGEDGKNLTKAELWALENSSKPNRNPTFPLVLVSMNKLFLFSRLCRDYSILYTDTARHDHMYNFVHCI